MLNLQNPLQAEMTCCMQFSFWCMKKSVNTSVAVHELIALDLSSKKKDPRLKPH